MCVLQARLPRGRALFAADVARGAWFLLEEGKIVLEGVDCAKIAVGRGEIIGDFEGIVAANSRGFKAVAIEDCSFYIFNSYVVGKVVYVDEPRYAKNSKN